MVIDLNKYAINRPFIQQQYDKEPTRDVVWTVSMWAACTHCPCIVLAFYIAEHIGYTKELVNTIDHLIKDYGYTEILNQLPGSPYLTMDRNSDIKD